jgi:hypothetical protein
VKDSPRIKEVTEMSNYTINYDLEELASKYYKAGNHRAQVYALDTALRSVNLYTKTTDLPGGIGTMISTDTVMQDEMPDMAWYVMVPKEVYGYQVACNCNGKPKAVGTVNTIAGVIAMVTSRLTFK